MQNFFLELFDYNHQSNQQLIEAIQSNQKSVSPKTILLFSHILNAQHIWNQRVHKKPNDYGVWQLQDVNDFDEINEENHSLSLAILQNQNLNETINYNNTKGDSFTNTIRDVLFHIINHSTYHRAQVASEFRNANLKPLVTDYIFYKR